MFEAYSVGVRLRLIDGVSRGLFSISQQFAKTHQNAKALQSQLDKIKLTMVAGGAMLGAGAFGFSLIGQAVKPAAEYAHQLAQMRISGMKNLEIAQATAAAWSAAKTVPTSSAAENLAAIRELRMVFGNTDHAIQNVATVQKLQAILASTGRGGKDEAYTVAKALEMKGAVRNPGEFNSEANLMAKAVIAGGGKVSAADFLNTFKYGRSATQGWSNQFAYAILPTLIQELKSAGGSGSAGNAGTALMSAYSAVVGGTVPQKALGVWQKLGLLDPSKIIWNKVGSAKGLRPGAIKGNDLFQANPYEWAQTVLLPALQAHGISDEKSKRQALQYLFPNRTAGFIMQQLTMQGWKFQRDVGLINKTSGMAGYNSLLRNDPTMAYLALQKQWENAKVAFGIQVLPMLIKATENLTGALRLLSDEMRKHPRIVKALGYAFLGLSAALAFSGSVLLLRGAFWGLKTVISAGQGGGLVGAATGAAGALGKVLGVLGAIGAVAYFWNKPPTQSGGWGAFLNDPHWLDKRLGLYHGPADQWDKAAGGRSNWFSGPSRDDWNSRMVAAGLGGGWHGDAGGSAWSSPYVAPSANQAKKSVGNVYLDKKKVGEIVLETVAKQSSGPQTGLSGFDPTMSLLPVGGLGF